MAEVKFCLKSLVAAILVVLCLQIHMGNQTAEQHLQTWLETSPMARELQKVAEGGALAIRNATKSVSQLANKAMGSSEAQKASRLNMEFQRSPLALKKQNSKND